MIGIPSRLTVASSFISLSIRSKRRLDSSYSGSTVASEAPIFCSEWQPRLGLVVQRVNGWKV